MIDKEPDADSNKTVASSNIYKLTTLLVYNSITAVSMNPGDRKVAGCFIFSSFFGGFLW